MSATSDSDSRKRPNRAVSAPARPPRPRRTLSLAPAVLVRVRGAMDRRSTRHRTSETQSTPHIQNEPRPTLSTFPDLVLQIMRRESPEAPETSNSGSTHIPHVQMEGGKLWEDFNSHATILEKDLQKFQDSVKELGSSLDLTGAARNMRKSVSLASRLFQENAKKLFPRSAIPSRPPRLTPGYSSQSVSRSWPPGNSQTNPNFHVESRPIYVELKAMADSVKRLRLAMEQFQEFGDGDTEDWPLMRFEGDLNYWSSCLERYEGQFESREVQLYVHDLSRELGAQFEDISFCLREVIDGIPTIRLAQKHFVANLQNLATIATFFSAVTATTLQYSFSNNQNNISKAVNVFWFNSLVFSIASALNSFLVLTWRRANYSSPRLHIPWWLWIWIRQCPPIFLLLSVVTFLAGLGCFTVSSSQAHYTAVIVIISETISAFGLAALLIWLAYDKWTFHRQRKTLLPVFRFLREKVDTTLPMHHDHAASSKPSTESSVDDVKPGAVSPPSRTQSEDLTPEQLAERVKLRARKRWKWVFEKVVYFLKAGRKDRGMDLLDSLRMDKLDTLFCKLAVSHELERHEAGAETNDIQFDPQGSALAICRSSLSMRFQLDSSTMEEFRHHIGEARQVVWSSSAQYLLTRKSKAIHVWPLSNGPVSQPHIIRANSNYILDVPNRTPNPEASGNNPPKLLSVEGVPPNKLVIVDILGKEYMVKEFKEIQIQHVDITPDGKRVLIAAVIPHMFQGDQSTKASLGRKLMVFNLKDRQIEHEVPLWHDVQHVTISVNGRWAVVTYKDYPPPQLWLLQGTPSGVRLSLERQFCARERVSMHEFDPSQSIRFSGRGHFIGNDRYILCTTADGKIHIWRRDKAHPVHVHGGLTLDKDKPVQITCNRTSNDFMFATLSHDGTVRVWKVHDPLSIRVDTTRLSIDPENSMGPPGLITLSELSESPRSEQSGATDIYSASSANPSRLVTHRKLNRKRSPQGEQLGMADIDTGNHDSGRLVPLDALSESPQGSPQRERPPQADNLVGGTGANDRGP